MSLDAKKEIELSKNQVSQGIIHLLSKFQEEMGCSLESESILNFIFELLDSSKSPQADAFKNLFNNLDVYYIFKMRLPLFISSNSPHKNVAIKLLHFFILNKPIVDPENIKIFFSNDATKNVISELKDAYNQFDRFHKRQLNSTEFGIGT